MLLSGFIVKDDPDAISMLQAKAFVTALIIGLFGTLGILTACVAVGTPDGVQFAAVFQSVLDEPFHVFSLLTVTVVSSISVIVRPSHKV